MTRERERHDRPTAPYQGGFSLIELLVVVLVIAILIAVAIPTLLGAQNRARDRAAQSNLRNAVTAAKTGAADHDGRFLSDDPVPVPMDTVAMGALEPSIPYVAAAPTTGEVGVQASAGGSSIRLWASSGSGMWFGLAADAGGEVSFCQGTAEADVEPAAACADAGW